MRNTEDVVLQSNVFVAQPMSTGNVDFASQNIAVFPNPSNGDFVISMKNVDTDVRSILVYDNIGRLIYSDFNVTGVEDYNIQLPESVSSGPYWLKMDTEAGTLTKNLMVEK